MGLTQLDLSGLVFHRNCLFTSGHVGGRAIPSGGQQPEGSRIMSKVVRNGGAGQTGNDWYVGGNDWFTGGNDWFTGSGNDWFAGGNDWFVGGGNDW
jgi:hypothetical protein